LICPGETKYSDAALVLPAESVIPTLAFPSVVPKGSEPAEVVVEEMLVPKPAAIESGATKAVQLPAFAVVNVVFWAYAAGRMQASSMVGMTRIL
jgi:hypothetical protein